VAVLVIRETVTTDYPAEGVGAAIKQAQIERGESIEKTIRAIGISRPYWLRIVNDDPQLALSKELYLRICDYFGSDFGVKF
jgi:plasmid maintenance system antidote protein VapI